MLHWYKLKCEYAFASERSNVVLLDLGRGGSEEGAPLEVREPLSLCPSSSSSSEDRRARPYKRELFL